MKRSLSWLTSAGLLLAMATGAAGAGRSAWTDTMVAMRAKYLQSPEAQKAAASDSLFKPFDSGALDGKGPAKQVVVNIAGLKELRLVANCEKANANCNIWGEPKLIAKDGTITKLTTLKPASVAVGWGQLLVNTNWQGHPLIVGDRKFEFGFWLHANSELTFALDGKYERFEAFVGEDKDRAAGLVRFKVLSTPAPLPACWADIARDFPLQAGWLRQDAGADGIASWFGKRESGALEQEIVGVALRDAPPVSPLCAELEALVASKVGAGDTRWLELYGRACRHRDCATMLKSLDSADLKAAFEKELATLVAAKAPAEDARWNELRVRVTQAAELDHQFATLEFDIKQRTVLSKATGERAWNGTRYVPTERSTADEIAKQTFNSASLVLDSDRDPADIVARRTAALLADLKKTDATPKLAAFDAPLAKLQGAVVGTPVTDIAARRALHHEICKLRRQIAFANPLLNFKDLVFIKRHRTFYMHMCDQFYGICQNPGGGLYVLENAFGEKPAVRDVLASAVCETGRLKGEKLSGGSVVLPKLHYDGQKTISGEDAEGGSFLSPALSPDGKQIAFAYVERKGGKDQIFHEDPARGHWDAQRAYHIFKVGVDGTRLQQLTDGTWNEFDPCWLPNGRMAFISERRGGYLRCGRACPLYTLYDMNPDGSGINCLSFHDSNEWHPSVSHDGRIVWTRWDYVDRHGCIAHMPWVMTLDGRDPRPLHGNYAPRQSRPDMELYVRPIPGSPKYVGLAAAHHGQAYGSIIIINPQVVDDDGMGPVRRFTPEVGFPESQGGKHVYSTPWPLSENYHLCVYDAAMTGAAIKRSGENYGIYLVDAFGNKELIYRDPDIGCMNPIPLRATPQPAAPASVLASTQATKPAAIREKGEATMAVVNVYDNQKGWAVGTKIKSLRVFQLLPCAVPSGGLRPHETGKRIAEAGDSIVPCRWVLGTVPVEEDGSAHFKVPAYRELFFQALDERGMAITSMRSATSLRGGEKLVCAGCHEHKSQATKIPAAVPLALRRAPSTPTPDVDGSHPFSYPRLVQPVLDRNCVKCHEENKAKKAPALTAEPIANKFYASYNNLVKFGFTAYGDAYRTLNGKFGARASKLIEMLEKGHHDVKLSEEDFHRLTLWVDCCSMFYGVFEKEPGEAQLRGEIARAILE
ncbi:MAG: NPCBM/NEW2 domain-containing protein [Verrucomicrobia bacterium]|nr:NPCBM/NEW2 domain-containing protein [Verrucomicrobiota bacterium]